LSIKITNMKVPSLFLVALAITFSFIACKPTAEQLANEKARTEAAIKEATEPLQVEINSLKVKLQVAELNASIDACKIRLEQLTKPRELIKQYEEEDLIEQEQTRLTDLQSQLAALQAAATTAAETPAADSAGSDTSSHQ